MSDRWTLNLVKKLRDQVVAGVPRDELETQYGLKWVTLYKVMTRHDMYPFTMDRIGVATLRALHAEWLTGTVHLSVLSQRHGLTESSLRNRWKRMGLRTSLNKKQTFPKRRIDWNLGLTIWTMRSKGKRTREICEAIGRPYDVGKSARYIRHHLLRWCYDTHTKVPSFEYGTFRVKWLPPPTRPPTGGRD